MWEADARAVLAEVITDLERQGTDFKKLAAALRRLDANIREYTLFARVDPNEPAPEIKGRAWDARRTLEHVVKALEAENREMALEHAREVFKALA